MIRYLTLVSYPSALYEASQTMGSALYTEDGKRYDYGRLEHAMQTGFSIHIRPCTRKELEAKCKAYNLKAEEIGFGFGFSD